MRIRQVTCEDLPELFAVRAATRENPMSREALRELGVTEASTAQWLSTTHRGWLAEVDHKIVGFAIGDGSTGELWVIAVLPAYEGQGIGSMLLRAVEEWLSALGWAELWLWTSNDQKLKAFSFYLKHGWSVAKVEGATLTLVKRKRSSDPTLKPSY